MSPPERTTDHRAPPALVIFDMDDVLVRYSPDARRTAMGALAGLPAREVERLIWDSGLEDAADAGLLTAQEYLDAIGEALGVPFGREEWVRTRGLAMTEDASAIALAASLRSKAKLALLTNNGFLMQEHFDILAPALRPIFGPAMHVAAEFRTKKPDPDIYRRLSALHGVAPDQAMMIDDKEWNVAGAREAGLVGHHFLSVEGLAAHLAEIGLI